VTVFCKFQIEAMMIETGAGRAGERVLFGECFAFGGLV